MDVGAGAAALWGAIGMVLASALTYLGVRYTARQARAAKEKEGEAQVQAQNVANRQVDLAEWQAILAERNRQIERQDAQIARQDVQIAEKDTQIEKLLGRVSTLERLYLEALRGLRLWHRWFHRVHPGDSIPVQYEPSIAKEIG